MEKIKKNNFINILFGLCISILISMFILFVFAIVLVNTNVSESVIPYVVIFSFLISILIGGIISSIKIKKNGILNGGIVGLIYITFLYVWMSMTVVIRTTYPFSII